MSDQYKIHRFQGLRRGVIRKTILKVTPKGPFMGKGSERKGWGEIFLLPFRRINFIIYNGISKTYGNYSRTLSNFKTPRGKGIQPM